jgi:hypothetical protein
LYLIAGSVLVVYGALNGLVAFTEITVDPKVFEAGYVAGFLGLLGIYPKVANRSPWLARIGALTGGFGLIAFSVFTVFNIANLVGLTWGDPPGWAAFTLMAASGFVVGYLVMGGAVVRSGAYSRTVGLLLLVPGIIIVLMFVTMFTGLVSDVTIFVVSAGQGLTHLAIGSSLRAESESTEQEGIESLQDETARA